MESETLPFFFESIPFHDAIAKMGRQTTFGIGRVASKYLKSESITTAKESRETSARYDKYMQDRDYDNGIQSDLIISHQPLKWQ